MGENGSKPLPQTELSSKKRPPTGGLFFLCVGTYNIVMSTALDRKILELSALYEVAKTLGSSLDLKKTAQEVFGILHKRLGLNRGTLVLRKPGEDDYSIWAGYGLTASELSRGRYRKGEGVTGKVLATGHPMGVPNIDKEPLFLDKTRARGELQRDSLTFLCVPIQVAGQTIGVLSADRIFDESASLDDDLRFLTVLASLMGQAIRLAQTVQLARQGLEQENKQLHEELKVRYRLQSVVGHSRNMEKMYETVERVAPTRSTVLLRGESGTGKELVARALHYNSPRADKPFIRVSCAALPETLLESELFGHDRGAFTGATDERKGRFELADRGTLFLDEIGEISLATQVKLLRVLQERKFERLGGTKTLSVDVRVVAATNRDLEKAVAQGQFREDLFYRLNVIPLVLPPLREREGDVPLLVEHFLGRSNTEHSKSVVLSPEAFAALGAYAWPGNVRELENCMERVVVLALADKVELDDLPLAVRSTELKVASVPTPSLAAKAPAVATKMPASMDVDAADLPQAVRAIEKERLLSALREHGGIQTRAAKALGLSVRQLNYKIKKYGIRLRVPVQE